MFQFLKRSMDAAKDAEALAYVVNMRAKDPVRLGVSEFMHFARVWNINPLHLHAFFFVESANSGFMADGRLIVCPEPHVAYRNSAHGARLSKLYPQLYYKKWVNEAKLKDKKAWHPYRLSHIERWDHIIRAAEVDFNAGLCGASYGAGQQLGEGWLELGFTSVVDFLETLYEGQHTHLEVMIRKLRVGDQFANLQSGDFAPVVKYYNGDGNVPVYLAKLENAIKQKKVLYA